MSKVTLFLITFFLIIECAVQRPPSGGPVDKITPRIVQVFPAPNSTLVNRDTKVIIEFSERMEKKTVQEAFFMSPRPSEELSFKWKGRKLHLVFPDSLKKNKTYILTIGTAAADLRRNKLEESFHLAFSTGDKLDQGKISGTVSSKSSVEGTMIGAYPLEEKQEPNPAEQYAEYVTQCNAKGSYQFSYISPGKYRLFAIKDSDADQKYDSGYDAIGVPTTDVILTEEILAIDHINFQITVKDTILPTVKSVIDIDQHHVDVRFSEPMAEIKNDLRNHFNITDQPTSKDTLRILDLFQNSIDGSRFHLKTETQQPELSYIFIAKDMFDLQGNPIDTSYNSYMFKSSVVPDTIKPGLIQQSINHNAKDMPLNPKIQLIFSEALICSTLEQHFNLADSNRIRVNGTYFWQNPADFTFIPDTSLTSEMKYHVHVAVDSVFDEFGNSLADSAIDFDFITLNKDTLSSITGSVKDELENAKGKIYLTAKQAGNDKIFYETVLDSTGTYQFNDIFPGVYLIYGFRDADSNRTYSYGQIKPFVPAERFIFYSDSIKVRSRWPNEGNDLIFNEY